MKKMYILIAIVLLSFNVSSAQMGLPAGQAGMMGRGMMGQGMMGMMGQGMMGMMGQGMMGMMGYYSGTPKALSHAEAKKIINNYLTSLNNSELKIDEFEEYSGNFYVSLLEKNASRGAIELIIDRYSGSYQPEPQSMMWNSKYGMMGSHQQAKMTISRQKAMKIAQDFLDAAYPGTKAGKIAAYYGYYTIMTKLKGKHYGMLSVNGYSGDVWYHTWHGMFIAEVK